MVGDPNTGFLVGQSQTFPDGTVKYSEYRIGGTSLSSPAVRRRHRGGRPAPRRAAGLPQPQLYSLAGTSAFRDVDHGRAVTDGVVRVDFVNGVDSKDGLTTSLRTLNQTGTHLHPQGLRRRHRRRQPQRRELLHRGRGRDGCARTDLTAPEDPGAAHTVPGSSASPRAVT